MGLSALITPAWGKKAESEQRASREWVMSENDNPDGGWNFITLLEFFYFGRVTFIPLKCLLQGQDGSEWSLGDADVCGSCWSLMGNIMLCWAYETDLFISDDERLSKEGSCGSLALL